MGEYTKWLASISSQLLIIEKLLNILAREQNVDYPGAKEVFDGFNEVIDIQTNKYQDLVKEEKEQCKSPTSTG